MFLCPNDSVVFVFLTYNLDISKNVILKRSVFTGQSTFVLS